MCLIVVGWQLHPDFPLVVAANRDEFYARPSADAGFWPDDGNGTTILGGRDLQAGGTWLAADTRGRFAAVTNVREPDRRTDKRSRGELPVSFLRGTASPVAHARGIDGTAYAGFNLLLCDGDTLVYSTNRHGDTEILPPGIYGLSNHRLDTPWPKLTAARDAFRAAMTALPDPTGFFALLAEDSIVPDADLPNTGVSLAWERRLSAVFVRSAEYGTRASTVLTRSRDGDLSLIERSFGPHGVLLGETQHGLRLA